MTCRTISISSTINACVGTSNQFFKVVGQVP
ncbi:MAG: hypothetical protein ACI814_003326, partial [Mariniblastus sp.]